VLLLVSAALLQHTASDKENLDHMLTLKHRLLLLLLLQVHSGDAAAAG
jgi:hypothetical protein